MYLYRARISGSTREYRVSALIEEANEYVRKAGRGAVNVSGELTMHLRKAPDMYKEISAAAETGGFAGPLAGLALGWIVACADNQGRTTDDHRRR